MFDQQKCPHNQGFSFIMSHNGNYPAGWYCRACGFYMNFDPFRYPGGIAIVDKDEAEKPGPIIKSSKF
jgi:hypothetical protein